MLEPNDPRATDHGIRSSSSRDKSLGNISCCRSQRAQPEREPDFWHFSIIDDRVVLVLVAFISDGRSTRTHQWLRSESPMTFPIFSISCCNIICITALIFRVFLAYIISTLLLHYYFGRESNFIFLLIAFICIHIIKDILELVYGSVVYAKLLLKSNGIESFVELTNL
jgi:hypothetical protein